MALLVNGETIVINEGTQRQFVFPIPNNLTIGRVTLERLASATPFPVGEARHLTLLFEVSTDGGANFTEVGSGGFRDEVASSLEAGGFSMFFEVAKSPNRQGRVTIVDISGELKFRATVEVS